MLWTIACDLVKKSSARSARRLMAGALLVALAGAPSLARAATVNAPLAAAVAEVAGRSPVPVRAATPELGKFEGGSSGIYIGGGTVVVILLVVLIVILI
jgi:hypothetical protein